MKNFRFFATKHLFGCIIECGTTMSVGRIGMIVSEKHKFVCMCAPKTATMMMEQILKPYGGVYHNGQPWPRHPNQVPKQYGDYYFFTTTRNPYSRVISMWFSIIDSWPRFKYGVVEQCGKELKPFLQMLNTPQVTDHWGGFPMVSMSTFLAGIHIDHILRFEHLEEDIVTLPFWGNDKPTLKHNVRGHLRPHWSCYFRDDDENAKLVQQWAGDDFKQFGYDIQIPVDKSPVRNTTTGTAPCVCGSGKQLRECCNEKQIRKYFEGLSD